MCTGGGEGGGVFIAVSKIPLSIHLMILRTGHGHRTLIIYSIRGRSLSPYQLKLL